MVPRQASNKNNTNSGSCDDTFTMVIYRFKLDQKRTGLLLDYLLEDKVSNVKNETQPITFSKSFGGITHISDMKVGSDGFLQIFSLNAGGDDCGPTYQPGNLMHILYKVFEWRNI